MQNEIDMIVVEVIRPLTAEEKLADAHKRIQTLARQTLFLNSCLAAVQDTFALNATERQRLADWHKSFRDSFQ